jgi:hypothetical protein
MAVIPVEHTVDGEVVVEGGGIGDVADEAIDIRGVGREPGWIKVTDYSGRIDEVSVTKGKASLELL